MNCTLGLQDVNRARTAKHKVIEEREFIMIRA